MAENIKKKNKWTRRAFIATGGFLGLGLAVGAGGYMYVTKKIREYSGEGLGDGTSLNAWIRIAPDNTITMAVPRSEMGQGVYTAMPMLMAEELEVDMSSIKIIHPQPESPYANTFILVNKPRDIQSGLSLMEKVASFLPVVATGGSTTIRDAYDHLRAMGATARELLIRAAADQWDVDKSQCYAENAYVINKVNKEKLSYGSLAAAASKIQLDGVPKLKAQKDFKIIGKPIQRLDVPEKVTGAAKFGLDARVPNMVYAVIRHPAYIGGNVTGINNQSEVEAMPGIKRVLLLPEGQGAAVVANNTWRAKNGAMALDLEETANGSENLSSAAISKMMEETIANKLIATPEDIGDVATAFNGGETIIEAKYEVPYLAQATMEPLNCTLVVDGDRAEAWVGHQGSSLVRDAINAITNTPKENIKVNMAYLGGGFGRRAELDFVKKAAMVAKEMPGTPIQLVFTREEDMRNGMYRPAVASHFKAAVNKNGTIEGWENKIALQSVGYSSMMRIMPAMATPPEKDPSTTEGAVHLPYDMNSRKVSFGQLELPVQVGNWRSVGSSQNAFFTECFIDECAVATGQDPYEFRKSKLKNHPRFLAVLNKVAERSNWSKLLPEGKYRGIALHKSFGSIVGEVAEISQTGDKEFKIDKMYCVIDCGRIVNPNTVEAQMQSGIIFGLSAALYGEITVKDGQIEQYNFPQYEMVRMGIAPTVDVHIMEINEYPGGVGEPSTPPAAPALANALFAATGERVRSLPLNKHGYKFV